MKSKYDSDEIEILEDLEHVRLRPDMYVGDTDLYGLHHILKEVIDNAIDEYIDGHVTQIGVKLDTAQQTVMVVDNGRGIPVSKHKKANIPTITAVFTKLHSGGKFRDKAYTGVQTGLHGIGVKATNALSKSLTVWTNQKGVTYKQEFAKGEPVTALEKIGNKLKAGTRIVFTPDFSIFKEVTFDPDRIRSHLQNIARLCPNLSVKYKVDDNDLETFHYENGLENLLEEMTKDLELTHEPLFIRNELCDVALVWTDREGGEKWASFVNVSPTPDHGTHVKGAKRAIQEVLSSMADKKHGKLKGDDLRDGLVAAIHARVKGPKFRGQTKFSLKNKETEAEVAEVVEKALKRYASANSDLVKTLLERAVEVRDAKKKFRAQQKAIKSVKNKGSTKSVLPGKLCSAPNCGNSVRELFIVEGDSAFGITRDGRVKMKDSNGESIHFQEVFPLRGKPLNVEKKPGIEVALANAEMANLTQAIGAGIGPTFKLDDCRYAGIYLLADADPDGKHIVSLLLTFFTKYMPVLIEEDRLRVVLNPLFRGVSSKKTVYGNSIEEVRAKFPKNAKIKLSRFKGLGESGAVDIRTYAMNPKTRKVCRVIWGGKDDKETVLAYMGDDAKYRKKLLKVID